MIDNGGAAIMRADRVGVPRKMLEDRTEHARRRSVARRTDRVRVPRKILQEVAK